MRGKFICKLLILVCLLLLTMIFSNLTKKYVYTLTKSEKTIQKTCLSEFELLFLSLCFEETGGTFKKDLKNSNSTATGVSQMLEIYVDECNRICGADIFSYDDRLSYEKCYEMFCIMQEQYNPEMDVGIAIRLHSVGFGPENKFYNSFVMKRIEYIKNYEELRKTILKWKRER